MTNCDKIFKVGSFQQIHGGIITELVNHATRGLGRGSSKVTPSRDGSGSGQVLFYGFMENVCCRQLLLFVVTDGFSFVAGAGKSVLWYVHLLTAFVSKTYCVG